jgi:hypothetical protein
MSDPPLEAEYFDRVRALNDANKSKFSPSIQLLRSIDWAKQAVRFGPLHMRLEQGLTVFHFDNFDIVTSPIRHGIEFLYQGFKYNNW